MSLPNTPLKTKNNQAKSSEALPGNLDDPDCQQKDQNGVTHPVINGNHKILAKNGHKYGNQKLTSILKDEEDFVSTASSKNENVVSWAPSIQENSVTWAHSKQDNSISTASSKSDVLLSTAVSKKEIVVSMACSKKEEYINNNNSSITAKVSRVFSCWNISMLVKRLPNLKLINSYNLVECLRIG